MKKYGRFDVTLPDEKFVWAPDEVTLGEQLMLEKESGQSYEDWISQVGRGRAEACQILVWFLRRKQGVQLERFSVDFPIRELELDPLEEDDPDPEAPAGSEPATDTASSTGGESLPSTSTG